MVAKTVVVEEQFEHAQVAQEQSESRQQFGAVQKGGAAAASTSAAQASSAEGQRFLWGNNSHKTYFKKCKKQKLRLTLILRFGKFLHFSVIDFCQN